MMKKYLNLFIYLIFLGCMFHGLDAVAQQKTLIKGLIKDKETGEPLIGVSVAEMDKTNRFIGGTVTDHNGEFGLRVSDAQNRISFQYIGYKTLIEEINGRANITVLLETESKQLQEVTVVAKQVVNTGNLNIDQREIATAVSRIDAKELEDIAAASIDEALQGRLSGVDIVANTGDPGAGMSIRIRGTTSIGANAEPLIVVDGIPYETKIDDDFNFSTADEEKYSQLINIPTEDIKEISVLKDAASASQYGTRAANGVIVITTKRGFKGKATVAFATKNSISVQPEGIPLLNGDQYAMLIRQAYLNPRGKLMSSTSFPEFAYDPTSLLYNSYNQNTDWVDAITQTGVTTENNLSVSGGGDKSQYRLSLGYYNQTGTTIGTGLSRLTSSISLDYNVSDKIKFSTDFKYTHSSNDRNYEIDKDKPVRSIAQKKMPNMTIYERDPLTGEATDVYFTPPTNSQGNGVDFYNPVAMAKLAELNETIERISPTFRLGYFLKSIQFSLDVNFDIQNNKTHSFLPLSALGVIWSDANVNKSADTDKDRYAIYTAASMIWRPDFGENHSLQVLLKATTNDTYTSTYNAIVPNSASPYLTDPSITANIMSSKTELNSGYSQSRSVGQLLSASYNFMDILMLQSNIRRDGSSRFGVNYRFGYFPSIAARLRVSGFSFMKDNVSVMDEFSIRGSLGKVGNAPDKSYAYFNNYSSYDWTYAGLAGVYPSNMELKNLRWEVTTSWNIGANIGLWKSRVTLDAELYGKRTTDLYSDDLLLASSSGYDKLSIQNIGTMDNKGWEISLNAQILRSKNLNIDFAFNIANNKNMIKKIADNYPQEKGSTGEKANYLQRLQVGNPLGSFYGYRFEGVYADRAATVARDINGQPITDLAGNPKYMRYNYPVVSYTFQEGDAIYDDINNDGNINQLDIVYLGDANPRFTGGFGPRFTFKKNLSLSLFFNYRYGNDLINKARYNTENMRGFDNQSTAVLSRWRNPGDVTEIPRALYSYGYNDLASSRFVEDGSFLRLRTVTVSYTLPKKFVQKIKFQNCKAYVTASNLLTFTNYTGQDPEVSFSSGKDPFKVGVDNSMTPRSKEVTLGLNFTF